MVDKTLNALVVSKPTSTVQSALEAWDEINTRADRLSNELESSNATNAILVERVHWLEKELSDARYAGEHYRRVNQELSTQLTSIAMLFNEALQRVKDANYSRPTELVPLPPRNEQEKENLSDGHSERPLDGEETKVQEEKLSKPQGKGNPPIPSFLAKGPASGTPL